MQLLHLLRMDHRDLYEYFTRGKITLRLLVHYGTTCDSSSRRKAVATVNY